MYSRGFNYVRPAYSIAPHEQHTPPPLSHHPYVYPSPRYAFNTYSPSTSTYPPNTPSSQYGHGSSMGHYNESRNMEIVPRENEVPMLHHLPQTAPLMDECAAMSLEHNCIPHASSCEQGNEGR